jgi:hypothetical protein
MASLLPTWVFWATMLVYLVVQASSGTLISKPDASAMKGSLLILRRGHEGGIRTSSLCPMRLRGGGEGGVFGIFYTVDSVGETTCGKSLWGFIKNILGLGSKGRATENTPEEDLAELQREKQAGKEFAMKRASDAAIVDKKLMYFLDQGLFFALSPITHLLRYVRGTEK